MRFRFSTVLVVSLLGMLLSMTALVAATSYFNAKSNAESLSDVVLAQAIERIDSRVRAQLDVAVAQSILNARLFARGTLNDTDRRALALYFVDAMEAEPQLTSLSLSLEAHGEIVNVQQMEGSGLEVRFLEHKADDTLELSDWHAAHGTLERFHVQEPKPENLPQSRPFYLAARKAGRPTWTETYTFFGKNDVLDIPGVTYATPLYTPSHALLGVLTADFDLRAMSRFLESLHLFDHGLAFIVEDRADGTRRVIAHPQLLSHGGEHIADARVEAMMGQINGHSIATTNTKFSIDGKAWVGSYRALSDPALPWTVCVVTLENDILDSVRRASRTTALIIASGVAIAIVLALVLGAILSRPLRQLADETEAIGRLQLESTSNAQSRLVEVERLSAAMEEMKRGLRSFRRYVPAELVHQLLKSGREAQVGGARRRLTIHFSDIADFTTIAESLAPEALVSYLGDYFSAMTESIHRSGGTVDKYIGDAIMAFWGAPQDDVSHALHACEAALVNRDRLAKLNDEWAAAGRPRFDARAAIHTGEVVVGNIGSGQKLDYTIIGDAVNLASRLEGLNKRYGTRLIISHDTWELVRELMIARPLARVSVKGKSKSVDIYELIGRRGEVPDVQVALADAHARSFALYLAREWPAAIERLRTALTEQHDDVAARLLLERCELLAASPPGPDWDGAEKMRTK